MTADVMDLGPDWEPGDHRFIALLPDSYRELIRDEAREQLVALRALANRVGESEAENPACNDSYTRQPEVDLAAFEKGLSRYLDVKYRLGRSDIELFVKTCFRGILADDLDLVLRAKLSRTVSRMLGKRDCCLPDGLPWRKVRDLIVRVHIDCADGGAYIGKDIRDAHCRNLVPLLRKCRNFLQPDDSTERIWNELGVDIDPTRSMNCFEPLLLMCQVLPTRGDSWTGWLPQAARTWQMLETSSDWDSVWLGMFARLAKNQPLAVDWTPYLSIVYERIPGSFRLPLGSAAPQSPVERRCPAHCVFLLTEKLNVSAAAFCVHTLTPRNPESFNYFERLIALVTNFFHPSNGGRWSSYLACFLGQFTSNLTARVARERSATKAGVNERVVGSHSVKPVAPLEDRLTDELLSEIVDLLLPLVQLGLHAKQGYMSLQSASAARDLAVVAPQLVIEKLLDAAASGLGSISSPHRTSAALKMLATLTPVFLDSDLWPTGVDFLPQALELTLPGIDPNDPSKTEATFRFIAGASARLQSLLANGKGKELSLFLEDYSHQLLICVFALLEALEAPPKKTKSGSSAPAPVLSPYIFSVAMENFFEAIPPAVAISAAHTIARQISGAASKNAMKFYGILVRISAAAAAAASGSSSAGIFLPLLLNQVLEEDEKGEPVLASLSDEELLWRLRMLAQACRSCGDVKPYCDRLVCASFLAMQKPSRSVYKAGGRLLRGLLEGLTAGKVAFGSGTGGEVEEGNVYNLEWRKPRDEEWEAAEVVLRRALNLAKETVTANGKVDLTDREKVFKALRMLHATQRGGRWVLSGALTEKAKNTRCREGELLSKKDARYILTKPLAAGLGGELGGKRESVAKELWADIYSFILEILVCVEEERPNDSLLLYRCLEPIELAHDPFKRSTSGRMIAHSARGYKNAYKPVMEMKRSFRAEGGAGRMVPGFIMKLRVEALHELRLSLGAQGGYDCEEVYVDVLEGLKRLAVNDFPKVRDEARGALTRALRVCKPQQRKVTMTKFIEVLDKSAVRGPNGTCDYERMMGSADVLRASMVNQHIMRDWSLLRPVALASLRALMVSERPDAAMEVNALYAKLAACLRPIGIEPLQILNSKLDGVDESSSNDLSTAQLHEFLELNKSLLTMVNTSNGNGVDPGPAPGIEGHWKLKSLVATTLYTNLRFAHPPASEVAKFFAESMGSDLMALRQVSKKAMSLLLAFQKRRIEKDEGDREVLSAIEGVLSEDFIDRLLRVLALDEGLDISESGDTDGFFGALSLTSLSKHCDGDACWALVGGRPWPSSWVARSRDTLSLTRVRLMEIIFSTFGSPMLRNFSAAVSALISSEDPIPGVTKENSRVFAAEVVAGIARGMRMEHSEKERNATESDINAVSSWAKELLGAFSGHEGMVNGGTLIRFFVSGEEGTVARSVAKLVRSELFESPIVDLEAPAHSQARRLRYLHASIADEEPSFSDAPLDKAISELTEPHVFSHPLKHVREEIARCMALLSSFTSESIGETYGQKIEQVAGRLKVQTKEDELEISEEDKKQRSRENDTLSRWVSVVHWNGDTHSFGEFLTKLLPSLFACLDDSDPERASHARLALSLAAQAKLNQGQIDRILIDCEDASKNRKGRIRGAVLPFLQVLGFSRLFVMDSDRRSKIRNIVITLLGDEQLEVREAATHTLVPLIRDAPAEAITETRTLLNLRLQKTKPKTRKKTKSGISLTTLVERHSAVLGLSSMVMSSPYSVPTWMPQVLVALTSCIDDPPPISSSARKLFTEFWRTHRDEWDDLKHSFNEEELETVSELLISPSYYA
ncbi:hypothetical protein NDN08_004108 [Rhodosorus marinus]|uniref:Proteasome activator complex subunit 4 C-terminal domain-containing protein n=1 Tax=Rhodosorus marinus TaxID=101924 RepID=A0AAV8UHB3_9RHOD|nr:hypothetical protein NDN08_004108 [Rhodosorus marinus]